MDSNHSEKPVSQQGNQKGNKISCTKENRKCKVSESVYATYAVLRWKFIATQAYHKKQEESQINKQLEKYSPRLVEERKEVRKLVKLWLKKK